ncbi:MAG TPA: CopG family transcriptional regulator [Candidatus Brocadiia bacterium]|nr:hypothetical protein [Candidatus Brocadiales bacterium]
MKKRMISSDMPIGKLVRIKDFLPPPAKLAVPEETTKVTISLKKSSIEFFKHQAERYHTKYQRMIRELIDRYALQYSKGNKR